MKIPLKRINKLNIDGALHALGLISEGLSLDNAIESAEIYEKEIVINELKSKYEMPLPLYHKIKQLIETEGYIVSSELGFPDVQLYLTAWNKDTRVQLNVKIGMKPPQKLAKRTRGG